jgi:hypothetical protein
MRSTNLPDTRDHDLKGDVGSCFVGANQERRRNPAGRS